MILLQRVSKCYPLYRRPSDRLLESLPLVSGKRHTDFWALRDVSLATGRGEFVAIVGPNGSGKSTLLQVASGILRPTSGRVLAGGRIAALLELGAGFNPEFTGRENVLLNGEILGISRRRMAALMPSIEAFAEIGSFIDRPVKEYSSGMYVRLAFSTAIHVEPEILIVDEALAVGDAIFASRCVRKFDELRRSGVTVLFVSHDLGLVKRLADRAILLLNGSIEAQGSPEDVVNRYVGLVHEWQTRHNARPEAPDDAVASSFRHGDRSSRVLEVSMHDAQGVSKTTFHSGEPVTVRLRAEFLRPVEEPVAGILVRNRLGIDVFGTNTRVEGLRLGAFTAGEQLEVEFTFPCVLARQDYTLTVATQHWDGSSQDWLDGALAFAVVDRREAAGVASLPATITWRRIHAVV